MTIKNGDTVSLRVSLAGMSKVADDEKKIVWSCSDSSFMVNSDGEAAYITASSNGLHKATLTVSHEKVVYPISIVLVGYNDPTELSELNTIYSAKTSYTILKGIVATFLFRELNLQLLLILTAILIRKVARILKLNGLLKTVMISFLLSAKKIRLLLKVFLQERHELRQL